MSIPNTRSARQVFCAPFFEKHSQETLRRVLALLVLALALVAGLPAQQKQSAVQTVAPADAVVITVTRFGPYPASFKHSAGPFVLWVMNHSNIHEDTFSVVDDVTGVALPSVPQLHSTLSRIVDETLIQLAPGTYRLIFQSHPKWMVKITVSAN